MAFYYRDEKTGREMIGGYTMGRNNAGFKYVEFSDMPAEHFHFSAGNTKIGRTLNLSFPIHYTCDHNAPCFKEGKCYGHGGCYVYGSNQAMYADNLQFFRTHTDAEVVAEFLKNIDEAKAEAVRLFNVGDLPNERFLSILETVSRERPECVLYFYTKKYRLVNRHYLFNGIESKPETLTIIFSHWRMDDGTFWDMENPFDFPTSEFIPYGMEDEIPEGAHICPCSDPNFTGTCKTCDHACRFLKQGECMCLLEHSTGRTRARDKAVKEGQKAAKKAH